MATRKPPAVKAPAPPDGPETQIPAASRWISPKKLALIHVVKKELGLADRDYRRILWLIAGVRSARDLDEAGFRKLMRYFVRSDYFRANAFGLTLKQKMFIKSLAGRLGWEPTHLTNFIRKYYRRPGLDHPDRSEASKLIESLKAIQARGSGRP
ncbi:MAG: phage protein GemA/Gp16 family protein [Acidobacteriota bacterium]